MQPAGYMLVGAGLWVAATELALRATNSSLVLERPAYHREWPLEAHFRRASARKARKHPPTSLRPIRHG